MLSKYGVKHEISLAYDLQTSGLAEVSNREIKQIMEKVVQVNRRIGLLSLMMLSGCIEWPLNTDWYVPIQVGVWKGVSFAY